MQRRPTTLAFVAGAWLTAALGTAQTQDAAKDTATDATGAKGASPRTARPKIQTNRWQEDWSALTDPALRTEPFDSLKVIPLSPDNPHSYLSLGLSLRERFESNDAPGFGVSHVGSDSYLLQRLEIYADAHFNQNWRFFTQLEDARAYGKNSVTPVDQNPLDLRLAFLEYVRALNEGAFKFRVGRQDFAFDLQRFVSSRDGPNVRQSFDAIWADWETGTWRFIGFVSQPVLYADQHPFDDTSNRHFRFHTLRVERHVFGDNELSAYYSYYQRDNARYLFASGDERRNIFDVRFAGVRGRLDWDLEAMGQTGSVGVKDVRAWATGTRAGYTFADTAWQPRIGLQADTSSGNSDPHGNRLGTFNPLFPNGYYFSLAGYTGDVNLIQLKPSVTVKPAPRLAVMGAVGFLWRQTTADAVYLQPNVPVPGTAGKGGNWSGAYAQLRADYALGAHWAGAIEAVHYEIGDVIRSAGGHDSNYIGIELRFGW